MKIAKIMVGNPDNKKGFFNNVIERTKHLMAVEQDVDCYIIRIEHGLFLRLLKGKFRKKNYEEYTVIDDIKFRNLWVNLNLINYLLTFRVNKNLIISKRQLKNFIPYFSHYDLLSSHDIEAIYLSSLIKTKYKIPFVTTWHGSDINIRPFKNSILMKEIKNLLESADHNFFVSQKLLDKSREVSKIAISSVIYTPPSESFFKFNNKKIEEVLNEVDIQTKYVVGFVGSLIPIKNIEVLPGLFERLQKELGDISFIIVGDGKLEKKLSKRLKNKNIKRFYMLGKKSPEEMPLIMNCLDVLIIPSLNEGLPRVTLEALSCGVNVVGSNRGGIPEAIGEENCFALDNNFIENAASKAIYFLKNPEVKARIPEKFSWDKAVTTEKRIHEDIVRKS